MLVVDAINECVAAFYAGNGFVRLPDALRLVLPMQVIGGMGREAPVGTRSRRGRGCGSVSAKQYVRCHRNSLLA